MHNPEKEKIFYARTYRRLKMDYKESLIFFIGVVLPVLIVYLCGLEKMINVLVKFGVRVLSQVIPMEDIRIMTTEYSGLWTIEYIDLPTKYPQFCETIIHFVLCLGIVVLLFLLKKTGRPLAIFLCYCLFVHIANCIYFFLVPESFPYTTGNYSELYIKQEIGIGMMFILMAGLVLGIWGKAYLRYRIAAFTGICSYFLIFGTVRYILFLFVLYRFSIIYMAIMFFVIGPMVDFTYFVTIYAIFMNKMIKEYEKGEKRGEWGWS